IGRLPCSRTLLVACCRSLSSVEEPGDTPMSGAKPSLGIAREGSRANASRSYVFYGWLARHVAGAIYCIVAAAGSRCAWAGDLLPSRTDVGWCVTSLRRKPSWEQTAILQRMTRRMRREGAKSMVRAIRWLAVAGLVAAALAAWITYALVDDGGAQGNTMSP